MTYKGTVTLETERLLLRRFKKEDLEQIYYNCWAESGLFFTITSVSQLRSEGWRK